MGFSYLRNCDYRYKKYYTIIMISILGRLILNRVNSGYTNYVPFGCKSLHVSNFLCIT